MTKDHGTKIVSYLDLTDVPFEQQQERAAEQRQEQAEELIATVSELAGWTLD